MFDYYSRRLVVHAIAIDALGQNWFPLTYDYFIREQKQS